ncbi:hypothetical protein F7P73_04970 [Acinetobacter bohemicus]|uniref:Uncharacterized protein n=1 Tax=Acinetobacter bohemicus TaxID=1435036 RepID=A0A1I6QFB7_9GAMM|nr:hypothetical protein [Acinetobacter bohemicus]KAB0653862.1 hypothetical protein F7P73_04970 [Acinetobacter bohemicus]SFS51171.1 hypothetical protein SAMN05444586_100429 [Acinetobacter bohemicus]
MANEKQKSLRLLRPTKNIKHLPVLYGISGFFTGAIFSLIMVYIYLNHHEIQKPLAVINTQLFEQKILEELDDQVSPVLEKYPTQQENHNDLSVKDENIEHTTDFPQAQNMDLSQAFLHHHDSKKMTSNLNNTVKEHQITAKNSAASKVALKTETAKLIAGNKVLTAQNGEKESNLLKVNNVAVSEPPEASIQITVTRTPIILTETAVSP